METITDRQVLAQDPIIGRPRPVTPVSYLAPCALSPSVLSARISIATSNADATAWGMTGRQETKVDFHDRWPLHSTS